MEKTLYLLIMTVDLQNSKQEEFECDDCKKKVSILNYLQQSTADINRITVCNDCISKYSILGINHLIESRTVEGYPIVKNEQGIEYVEVPCLSCKKRLNLVLKEDYDKNPEYFKNLKENNEDNKTSE